MEEPNGFIIADLLKAKLSRDTILQEVQSWSFEPDEKVKRCQQYCHPLHLIAAECALINFLYLLIGKLVEVVVDEYSRGCRRKSRFRPRATGVFWVREGADRTLNVLAPQLRSARNDDHRVSGAPYIAERPGEDLRS